MFKVFLLILVILVNIAFICKMFFSDEREIHIRNLFKSHPFIVGTSAACLIAGLVYSFAFNL